MLMYLYRPQEFLKCDLPVDLKGNSTARDELGYGCVKVCVYVLISSIHIMDNKNY